MINDVINKLVTVLTPLVNKVDIVSSTIEQELNSIITPVAFIGSGGTTFDSKSNTLYMTEILMTVIIFLNQPMSLQDDLNNNTLLETICKSINNCGPSYTLDNLELISKSDNLSIYQINFKVTGMLDTK